MGTRQFLNSVNKLSSETILNTENGLQFFLKYGKETSVISKASIARTTDNNEWQNSHPEIILLKNVKEELQIKEEELQDQEIVVNFSEAPSIKSPEKSIRVVSKSNSVQVAEEFSERPVYNHIIAQKKINTYYNFKLKESKKRKKTKQISTTRDTASDVCNLSEDSNDILSIVTEKLKENKHKNRCKKVMINPSTGQFYVQEQLRDRNADKIMDSQKILQKFNFSEHNNSGLFLLPKTKPLNSHSHSKNADISVCSQGKDNTCNNFQKLKSNSVQFPKINFIKGPRPSSYSPDISGSSPLIACSMSNSSSNSKIIYWEEGNVDSITDPLCLSDELKNKYGGQFLNKFKSTDICNSESNHEYFANCDSSNSFTYKRNSTIVLSWNSVLKRISETEEETETRFVVFYKTPNFRDNPKPFKEIQFELKTVRKEQNVFIPKNGMPFIFLGINVFSCHLGERRGKSKEENEALCHNSKKIGCPAKLSVARIARFPDFDISLLSPDATSEVLDELRDAWDICTSRVRYFIEYYISEPSFLDHKGHEVQNHINNNRFHESVDPRIVNKIRELTRNGVKPSTTIEQLVQSFVKEELFNGKELPSERRRYNPSLRDIRYEIQKARAEMKKEEKSATHQEQCVMLAKEIASLVKNIKNEQYLSQLKSHLKLLTLLLKEKNTESTSLFSQLDANESVYAILSTPQKSKKRKTEAETVTSEAATPEVLCSQISVPNFDNTTPESCIRFPVEDVNEAETPGSNGQFNLTNLSAQEIAELSSQVEFFYQESSDANSELLYLIPEVTFESLPQ